MKLERLWDEILQTRIVPKTIENCVWIVTNPAFPASSNSFGPSFSKIPACIEDDTHNPKASTSQLELQEASSAASSSNTTKGWFCTGVAFSTFHRQTHRSILAGEIPPGVFNRDQNVKNEAW